MLNHNFLTSAKDETVWLDSLYCVTGKKFLSHDRDLDRTMPNVKLVRAISLYSNILKFRVSRSIII